MNQPYSRNAGLTPSDQRSPDNNIYCRRPNGDVVSQYLSQIMGAIRRMDLRQPPQATDVEIVRPMLVGLATELNKDDPIRFTQIGRKFVVDATEFRVLLGFGYLQELLKKPGQWVSTRTLSPVGGPVIFEPVAEYDFVRKHVNRKYALEKRLKWMRHGRNDLDERSPYEKEEEFEIAEELLKIGQYLSGVTFGGKIKHIHNNYDRNRQTVTKCIRLAIKYLEDNPATAHIGQHLRDNVKTGARCRYTGDWMWKID